MELDFIPIYNREVNQIDKNLYEMGLFFFISENESEENYIFYSKFENKIFYISKDKGIISNVYKDLENNIVFKPIFLNDTEMKIINITLNDFVFYKNQNENKKTIEVINAIKTSLEVLLNSKIIKNEFEPNLSQRILSMIK